jgi:hypothetical protein
MVEKQNAQIVTDYLKANKGRYYCERCISANTGVQPTNQVNQIVRPLAASKDFRRSKGMPCSECGKERTCTAYVG